MPQVIEVLVQNGTQYNTATVPFTVPVADGNQTITWTAAGPNAQFPTSDYFAWKTSPAPLNGAIPTRVNATTLSLSYNNTFTGKWEYAITIQNGDTTITIDPEIDNGPPR